MKTARMPGFDGATRDDRRRRIDLGVLAPSQPYIYSPMTVVLGPKARERKIAGIGDIDGFRLVIGNGSLGDAILMTFEKGRLIDNITHLVPGRSDMLGALNKGGEFDDATPARPNALRRPPRRASQDTAITASG